MTGKQGTREKQELSKIIGACEDYALPLIRRLEYREVSGDPPGLGRGSPRESNTRVKADTRGHAQGKDERPDGIEGAEGDESGIRSRSED